MVEPRLPEEPAKPKGGRPQMPDRDALRGIVFVLRSGLPREMLPHEVFGCSDMTCWRRLQDWQCERRSAIDGVDGPACGIAMCQGGRCGAFHREEPSMDQPITIGLDPAESVLQAHRVDAEGRIALRRRLR